MFANEVDVIGSLGFCSSILVSGTLTFEVTDGQEKGNVCSQKVLNESR